MVNDDDFLMAFERAYTQNGDVLVPRVCYYLKNLEKTSARERKDLLWLLDDARRVLSNYDLKGES